MSWLEAVRCLHIQFTPYLSREAFLTDRWLADTTLFGTAEMVRDGVEAWFDAGIKTPIIVPSSASGGQMV